MVFQEFFSQRIYFKLILKLRVYKRLQKNANLSKFIGVTGGEKFKIFFKTTVNVCWFGSTLGFSYKGYSTKLLHQITTVSDYVMSFLETGGEA